MDILLQIAKGVLYLHKNGMARHDLKSKDVLVVKKNNHKIFMFGDHLVVKVADFGLMKPFESMNVNHCNTHLYKHWNTILEGA